jgi:phage/plasmid-associated DNA primase
VRRTDVFKAATGGDRVQAEHRYGQAFTFRPFALPIFSANEPPVDERPNGRLVRPRSVVPFERRFEGTADVVPNLGEKLANTPGELEGLLVAAVGGLRRLMTRGHFELPTGVRAEWDRYRSRLDSVRGFIDDECVTHPQAWVGRSTLYRNYASWARDGGRIPLSNATFYEHLERALDCQLEHRTRRGNRGYAGIGLASAEGEEPA